MREDERGEGEEEGGRGRGRGREGGREQKHEERKREGGGVIGKKKKKPHQPVAVGWRGSSKPFRHYLHSSTCQRSERVRVCVPGVSEV